MVNVGAGTGSYEPSGLYVIPVEPSDVMAAQRPDMMAPAIRAIAGDLPLRDGSVDAGMAVLSVHHWDEQQEDGIRELRRVTRGPVVIVTFDAAVSSRMWLIAEYVPEIAELDRRIFPSLQQIGACSAEERPSIPSSFHEIRRIGRLLRFGRIPSAFSMNRHETQHRDSRA